jgi:hypothetical protein
MILNPTIYRKRFWRGMFFGMLCLMMSVYCAMEDREFSSALNFLIAFVNFAVAWHSQSYFHRIRRIGGNQ